MLTFHVTDIDQYAWYLRLEDMAPAELAARLRRESPPNDKMAMGTAWHSILENPPDIIDKIDRDGYTFSVECDREIILPQVREIRASKTYNVDGLDVTLTGKVDGIDGNRVTDHKLTFRPDMEKYFEAYQWRAYLDIFNADRFTYYAYHAKGDGPEITITDVSEFNVYRYPDMVNDLQHGISGLLHFVRSYMPEMIKKELDK